MMQVALPVNFNPLTPTSSISALPERVDLELYRGDDFWVVLSVSPAMGQAFDLTGATARSQIREEYDSETAFEMEASIDEQVVTVHLTNQVSATLPACGVWDCQVTLSDATVRTLVAGAVTVSPQVTR